MQCHTKIGISMLGLHMMVPCPPTDTGEIGSWSESLWLMPSQKASINTMSCTVQLLSSKQTVISLYFTVLIIYNIISRPLNAQVPLFSGKIDDSSRPAMASSGHNVPLIPLDDSEGEHQHPRIVATARTTAVASAAAPPLPLLPSSHSPYPR